MFFFVKLTKSCENIFVQMVFLYDLSFVVVVVFLTTRQTHLKKQFEMSVKAKLTVTGTDVLIECRDAILQFLPGVPELWALSKCSKTLRLHYEKKNMFCSY